MASDWRLWNCVLFVRRRVGIEVPNRRRARPLQAQKFEAKPSSFSLASTADSKRRPVAIQRDAIVGQPVGPSLCVRQVAEPNGRDLLETEPLGREQTAMAGDENTAVIDQAWNVEAELRDRARDLATCSSECVRAFAAYGSKRPSGQRSTVSGN